MTEPIRPIPVRAKRDQMITATWKAPGRALLFGAICGAPELQPLRLTVDGRPIPLVYLRLTDGTWIVQAPKGLLLGAGAVAELAMHAGGEVDDAIELLYWLDNEAAALAV